MSSEVRRRAKLDENPGMRGAEMLRASGWDVETVESESLCSAADRKLIDVSRAEDRVLVSLDKDFSNTLLFPPKEYAGIVVLRLPEPLRLDSIEDAVRRLIAAAADKDVRGRLWIVDANRIREFSGDEPP